MARPQPEILILLIWNAAWDYVIKSLPSDSGQEPGARAAILLRAEWRHHGLLCRRRGFESSQPSAGRVSWRRPILSSVTGQEHPQEKSQMFGMLDLAGPGK